MNTNKMKVEVWSDIMCPFCYIGKRQYEAALRQFGDQDHIEVEWKSFQLDPSIPEDVSPGMTATEYLSARKGISESQVSEMHKQVVQMAKNSGLAYDLDHAVVYNSFKAHRIIQLAKTKGLGDQAEERFFKAHFTENQDLGSDAILVSLAQEIGLTASDALEALRSESYRDMVNRDIEEARQIGVNGVPFFVFNRKYAISGAQPIASFLQTLEKSFGEWRKENPGAKLDIIEGQSCTPEGNCSP